MKFYRPLFLLLIAISVFCFVPAVSRSAGDDWVQLDPSDLTVKTSAVEKDADSEAIFWQVKVSDVLEYGSFRTVLQHYLRIKIFTDRGRERHSKIDIPYLSRTEIKDISARTIKPDGTIVELKKEDVFEKTIAKASGVKLKAKSFAMPGIEAGAIIEYRWREVRNNSLTFFDRFDLQREIPVRLVKYYLKPARFSSYTSIGMNAKTFHGETTPFVKEKDGSYSTTMKNVPAFKEEPRMPPERELRAWMLVYYSDQQTLPPDKLWPKFGKEVFDSYKPQIKVNDEIKKAAAEAIGDASSQEDKLRRLFDFCRNKIRNVYDDASGLTTDERAKLKENKSSTDTLKRGFGTGEDIDVLFTALATAAGFEARMTRTSDRSESFFNTNSSDDFQLNTFNVAVKVGDEWRFFDPASKYVPYGMLRWQEEGTWAMVTDSKTPNFVKIPISSPEKSKEKRSANLTLTEDGTLEGEVRIEYSGHMAAYVKEKNDQDTVDQREESLKAEIKERMSTGVVTNIKIDNATDPEKPFVYTFQIKVPGYAQRTGKRLFLQPAFFQRGVNPLFATNDRKYPIYFTFPWSEEDQVIIKLPPGFALDSPDAPGPFRAGDISEYKPLLRVTEDGKTLVYTRAFFFGGGGSIIYPAATYSQLKALFDNLSKNDSHTITLKAEATASTPN